ncbi:MAG: hypothetical protein JL50_11340 [Peptococcaceae bacterium BICA1-7]|nr:MAG: hypothetical protein JL50_11340 [Peptococcaceae bacterium BICA1-7]
MYNIWMVNHYAITPDLPGGTRHYDFGCELIRHKCHIKIFASDVNLATRKHTRLKDNELCCIENINKVEFIWVRTTAYRRNDWRRAWNMLEFAWNINRIDLSGFDKPDVIIGSSPHPFAALAALRLARKFGARFFLELRDLWPQALVDMGGVSERHPSVKLMRLLEGYLYRKAEKIIVLAEGSKEYLSNRWKVLPERVIYLPNGVHMDNFTFRDDRDSLRARYGFEKFTLIYTGAHGPANSLETILKAAKRIMHHREVEFVLVGDGPVKENLVKRAAEMEINNVRFLNPVPKSEIPGLIAAADACIITLRAVDAFSYGISPNKIFDYMASKKPVICAVAGDMADLITRVGAGITVPPEDDESLSRAVIVLSNCSNSELEKMGQKGYSEITRNYSRQELAKRLLCSINI